MARTLFDGRPRGGPGYKTDSESVFEFYSRADGPQWERIRDELGKWYSHYPDNDGDLRKRFRDRAPDQHFAAWWELWVYTFYTRLGYGVVPHPTMPNGKKPDFLVTLNGKSTYVECKAIPEKPRSANEAGILDCTNEVKNPDFWLELDIDQEGPQTPSCNEIKAQLQQHLGQLNADDVISDRDAGKDLPYFQVRVQDWVLTYTAYPVELPRRGNHGRLLAIPPTPDAAWIDNIGPIRKAVRAKGRKYAGLNDPLLDPLIIAINTYWVPSANDEDEPFEALFGTPAFAYWQDMRPPEIHPFRQENGYWRRDPPAGTRVSAVLLGHNITPHGLATRIPRLLKNPWSQTPVQETYDLATTTATDAGQPVNTEGTLSINDLFGLAADWPRVGRT
ncbi:hypothetical protein MNAB215_5840 [Mycobacterium numidiamassiliense]|uniref:Uncharacterized protein n=1 Tax=Mycobacterium numidiamassiliense TaxID=1841861 RepID=A0A2U3PIM2_9MYCO|nr:hypothetical protein [Mycobacterium numidiamassiliense]SPM43614.1 hypothetical protein MNAB215_5840 [Mycobacterium numidiamassiliense]